MKEHDANEYEDSNEEDCLVLLESLKLLIEPSEKNFAVIDDLAELVKEEKWSEFIEIISSVKKALDEEIMIIDSLKLLNQTNS